MLADQGEMSFPGMVVARIAPCSGGVAGGAPRAVAKSASVHDVGVALLTSEWRVSIEGRAVALFASHGRMFARQWKFRKIMVERNVLSPVGVAMALLAALAKLTLMRVLFLMTGNALCRKLVAEEVTAMAGVAFRFLMGAMQGEMSLVVVEAPFFPFCLVVTGLALLSVAALVNVL
jgi:hypothetical protein